MRRALSAGKVKRKIKLHFFCPHNSFLEAIWLNFVNDLDEFDKKFYYTVNKPPQIQNERIL